MPEDALVMLSGSVVVRTCYSHEDSWQALLGIWYTENDQGFVACSNTVEDPMFFEEFADACDADRVFRGF
jgi:hypothetical protein